MSERKKIYSESRVHRTPSGNTRSEIFYFDEHRNAVDEEETTCCEILEYDENGRVLEKKWTENPSYSSNRTGIYSVRFLFCFLDSIKYMM